MRRLRLPSSFWLGLLLAGLLLGMAVLQSRPDTVAPYDPADTRPSGLRGLVLWLEDLGYDVQTGVPRRGLPSGPGLLWIHPAPADHDTAQTDLNVALIREFVEQGGTLVLVGPSAADDARIEQFGVVQVSRPLDLVNDLRQEQPLLPPLPSADGLFWGSYALSVAEERAFIPLLTTTSDRRPVVGLQAIGAGVVWHLTEDFALTNSHLTDRRVATLLPAVLRTVPADAPVIFSTLHLTYARDDLVNAPPTLRDWLYTAPVGQAILVITGLILVYLILQGRRLGPPLPAADPTRPRAAAEYVIALAGLQRRAGLRADLAQHHRQRLKHTVGRLVQVPPDLPDDTWLDQVTRRDLLSAEQYDRLAQLLTALAQADRDDTIIPLVREADALLASLPRAATQLVR